MRTGSLKVAYALVTIGVAARVYVIGEQGGDTRWIAGAYVIATSLFAALIVYLTLSAMDPNASRDERYFGTGLLSYWAVMPPVFFAWGLLEGDLRLALLAFSLSSGVSACFYLMIRAFHFIRLTRRGAR